LADAQQLLITDVLLCMSTKCHNKLHNGHNQNATAGLIQLLQQSSIEHMTTFRQLEAEQFGSLATIVTTDFEALYAYKHGDYQYCLHLSAQNISRLLCGVHVPDIPTYSEFVQLLDDDIVSLTALALIIHPSSRNSVFGAYVTQLTISLYLMTQCQLKLHHSATSLAQTLDYIEVAQKRHSRRTLDQLVLKLTERKAMTHITASINHIV